MKIPLNWLNEIIPLPADNGVLTDKLTMVGHMLDKRLVIDGEEVVDLELRGNRADCYSILGIAREVSAIFDTKVKLLQTLELTKVSKLLNSNLSVDTPLVKRAAMTEAFDVKITKSPAWLVKKLTAYGMESVNNIVDLTNYVMIETGEPMHAFDSDKVKGELQIRLAKEGEKMITFQGATLTLTKNDLVWSRGTEVLSVAGAIGEKYHSISETTKNILVEAANYDRANIRRSVYRHNLLTEAGIRHEKELDPNMVDNALGRFLFLLKKHGWGTPNCKIYDYYPKKLNPWKLKLNFDYLKTLAGVEIDTKTIKNILLNLNFKIIIQNRNFIEVLVPTYRTDVTLEEDLIEEVLRIYGYDNITPHVLSLEIPDDITPDYIKQENALRECATAVGFNEAITLSFVKESVSKLNIDPEKPLNTTAYLINPPSPDYKFLRMNLLCNLYELSKKTIHERAEEVRLFEIGKTYFKEKDKYFERRKIALVYYLSKDNSFNNFKSLMDSFFIKMCLSHVSYSNETYLLPLHNSFSVKLGNRIVGFAGVFDDIYYLEIDLDQILGQTKKYSVSLWPKSPPQIEDLTMVFPDRTYIGDVITSITSINRIIEKVELRDIFQNSYTFRIWYQDPNKTLTDTEVEKIRKEIITSVKNKFGGILKE